MNSAREQPHIAVVQRESLRWVPEPAGEVVDVFSMELGKYFMDLRIYKSGERRGQVDWAMAGVRQILSGSTQSKFHEDNAIPRNFELIYPITLQP